VRCRDPSDPSCFSALILYVQDKVEAAMASLETAVRLTLLAGSGATTLPGGTVLKAQDVGTRDRQMDVLECPGCRVQSHVLA